MRLSYSQFEELESFARFGTRLDEDTRRTLARGARVREVLKQPQYATLPAAAQVVTLLAVTAGLFDPLPLDRMAEAEQIARDALSRERPDLWNAIARRRADGRAARDSRRDRSRPCGDGVGNRAPMQTSEEIRRRLETAEDLHSIVRTMKALATGLVGAGT